MAALVKFIAVLGFAGALSLAATSSFAQNVSSLWYRCQWGPLLLRTPVRVGNHGFEPRVIFNFSLRPLEGTSNQLYSPGPASTIGQPDGRPLCSLIRGVPVLTRLGKEVVRIPGIDVVLAGVL